ncbi:MAG: B12-binding domain-containing radical SAM protein [Candidatus Scalinduaceae bacterium]
MKIALIQPQDNSGYPPLSVAYLSSYLETKGYKVRVFDLQIPAQRQSWQKDIAGFNPGIVGVTAMTPAIVKAGKIGITCKKILPKAILVLGGYHLSFLPEETMRQYMVYDAGVIGEGEITLHELVNTVEHGENFDEVQGLIVRKGNELITTGQRERINNLDNLPWPHKHYDLDYYLWYGGYSDIWTFKCASMIVSRGCPFKCRFCASQRFWSKNYRYCSPEYVIDEMKWLSRHGARAVYFRDSTFTVNKKWLMSFCEEKMRAGIKMRWICNSRVNTITEEVIVAMRDAGLEAIYFGVESGSQRVLDYYKKGTTVEQAQKAFALCHKYGIATVAFFMIGAPIETRKDIEETRKFAHELNAKYTHCFIYTPLPGSELYDDFIKHGYKPDFEHFIFNRAVIPIDGISPKDLATIHQNIAGEFKHYPNRGELWQRRFQIINSVHSLRDILYLTGRLTRRMGFAG